MKKLITALLACLLFYSCSTTNYYYSKINTSSPHVEKNYDGDFVIENDSVAIIYSFFGEDAPINIGIYNKTDKELYVDWSRSSLIIENANSTEKTEETKKNPSIKVQKAPADETVTYSQKIYPSKPLATPEELENKTQKGTQYIPDKLTLVPPHSQIDRTEYKLANFPFNKIRKSEYKNVQLGIHGGTVDVRKKDYSDSNSPLRIKSIITIYDGNPHTNIVKNTIFEQSFYLASVMHTGSEVHPTEVYDYITQQGDFFYVKHYKENKFGTVMGVIAISATAVALEVAFPDDRY